VHSEFKLIEKRSRFTCLQIWIHPDQRGLKPSYDQKNFAAAETQGQLSWSLARMHGPVRAPGVMKLL